MRTVNEWPVISYRRISEIARDIGEDPLALFIIGAHALDDILDDGELLFQYSEPVEIISFSDLEIAGYTLA